MAWLGTRGAPDLDRLVSLRPAAEVARAFYQEHWDTLQGARTEAGLTALVERVRAEALREAAEVARRFDPALDPGILPLRILGLQRPGQ